MIKEKNIDSVSQFIKEVDKFYDAIDHAGGLWFRGHSKSSYELLPSVLRKKYDENSIIEEFLVSYETLSENKVSDLWAKYALMQHYGLPTRLLDWTKSPLVALYFALMSFEKNSKCVVWAIDPYYLNKINYNNECVIVPAVYDQGLSINTNDYLPEALINSKSIPELPLAIETPYTNKRILFQQGCFTIHGTSRITIDKYFEDNSKIRKFVITGSSKIKKMQNSLYNLGIKEENIMQDLPSLTKRIVREWG